MQHKTIVLIKILLQRNAIEREREREKNKTKVVLYAAMPFTKQLYFSLTYKTNGECTSYATIIALQNYGFNIFFYSAM